MLIWKLWFLMCALWLAVLVAAIGWLSVSHNWLDALYAAVVYGIAPILAGSVLIYWSMQIAPWRPDQQE